MSANVNCHVSIKPMFQHAPDGPVPIAKNLQAQRTILSPTKRDVSDMPEGTTFLLDENGAVDTFQNRLYVLGQRVDALSTARENEIWQKNHLWWHYNQLAASYTYMRAVQQAFDTKLGALHAANAQLTASNVLLTASNEQLTASNEQLTASNVQLTASNVQLTASNVKLTADLQAVNSRLDALEAMAMQ